MRGLCGAASCSATVQVLAHEPRASNEALKLTAPGQNGAPQLSAVLDGHSP
jgi:hypothetical protein